MNFNKIIRGNKREQNNEQTVFSILDAGFLCTIAIVHNGIPMMQPTTYGRIGDTLYFHGSQKNFVLNSTLENSQICVSVTHLDGIVLARTLFNTSANYRSVILFGKAEKVTDENERMLGLKTITENIIPNRWNEVTLGNENEVKATMVLKMKIESASAKVRDCGPQGDESEEHTNVWSGHIPVKLIAKEPIPDEKFANIPKELPESVNQFLNNYHK